MAKCEIEIFNTLCQLEQSLANFESRDIAERALTDDFVEYGSSGKVYNKKAVMEFYKDISDINHNIVDYAIEFLSDTVVKATFKSDLDNKKALRTSIWKFGDNEWKMSFHQGTVIKE